MTENVKKKYDIPFGFPLFIFWNKKFATEIMRGKKSRIPVMYMESPIPNLGGYLASFNIAYLCAQYMKKRPVIVIGTESGTPSEKNTASKIIFIDYE